MTLEQNIKAVIESCFSESKEEIQKLAVTQIIELIKKSDDIDNIRICTEVVSDEQEVIETKKSLDNLCSKINDEEIELALFDLVKKICLLMLKERELAVLEKKGANITYW